MSILTEASTSVAATFMANLPIIVHVKMFPNGLEYIACDSDDKPLPPACFVTKAELAEVHPDLPVVLALSMDTHKRASPMKPYPVSRLQLQVYHVLHPLLMPSTKGGFYWLGELKLLHYIPGYDMARVTFNHCSTQSCIVADTTSRSYNIIANRQLDTVLVPKVWLDTTFADWEQRYMIGLELGLKGKALADYSCPRLPVSPAVSVSLPNIQFD